MNGSCCRTSALLRLALWVRTPHLTLRFVASDLSAYAMSPSEHISPVRGSKSTANLLVLAYERAQPLSMAPSIPVDFHE